MRKPPRRQRGIALITSLLVVAIATVVAVEIAARERLDIRRTQNIIAQDQAYDLALAAELWAIDLLKTDLQDRENPNVDGAMDNWAQNIMLPPYEGATLGMRIEDLQGRFNINNLSEYPHERGQWTPLQQLHVERFKRLLTLVMEANEIQLEIDLDTLVLRVLDWLDGDVQVRTEAGGGAEDLTYLGTEDGPPYRAANQMMASPTELMLVAGFTPQLYRALEPHITALPNSATSINVNTATPMVLRALDRRIDETLAENLMKVRLEEPWDSPGAFKGTNGVPADINTAGLGVQTNYFAYRGQVQLGPAVVNLHSLIDRSNGVRVLARARQTL